MKKITLRWDLNRDRWRQVFKYADGFTFLTTNVVRVCSCGIAYLGTLTCTGCDECRIARYRLLSNNRKSAYTAVARAIRHGLLTHPSNFACVDCNNPAECYDHRDYDQPLAVDPVCKRCNKLRGPAIQNESVVARLPKNFIRRAA